MRSEEYFAEPWVSLPRRERAVGLEVALLSGDEHRKPMQGVHIVATNQTVGQNVNLEVSEDGKHLVIRVDLTKSFGPSSTGKSEIVASTQGNAPVPNTDRIMLGLNLFRKR
jgi:hypothetical protein